MEYFIIYDLNDFIVAYFDNLEDLSSFTGLRKKHITYKFKNRDFIYYQINNTYNKIYKFYE